MLRVLRIIVCGASYRVGQASACQSERSSDSPSSVPPRQNTFSPETSPQLVDSSSWRSHQTSTVAPAALRGREISAVSALTRFDSPGASPPLPPRLRGSASKSPSRRTRPASQVSHPLPPRRRRGMSSALPLRSLRLRVKSPPSLSKTLRSHFPLCTKLAIVKYSIALASLACAAACAAVLPPYERECEARRNPVGIDAPQPRLSWKLRAEPQSAYQIQVGTSPDAAGLWDSRRTSSPDTSWIAYAGPPLESFRRYWWRVRVWNAAGEPSPWSDAAEWTQVPASASGWKGGWIAHPDHSLRSGPLPIFRQEFVVAKPLRRATSSGGSSRVGDRRRRSRRCRGRRSGESPRGRRHRATYPLGSGRRSVVRRGASRRGAVEGRRRPRDYGGLRTPVRRAGGPRRRPRRRRERRAR